MGEGAKRSRDLDRSVVDSVAAAGASVVAVVAVDEQARVLHGPVDLAAALGRPLRAVRMVSEVVLLLKWSQLDFWRKRRTPACPIT